MRVRGQGARLQARLEKLKGEKGRYQKHPEMVPGVCWHSRSDSCHWTTAVSRCEAWGMGDGS